MELKCPKHIKYVSETIKQFYNTSLKINVCFCVDFFFFSNVSPKKKQEMRVSRYNQHKITFNVSDFLFNFLFIYFKPGNFS